MAGVDALMRRLVVAALCAALVATSVGESAARSLDETAQVLAGRGTELDAGWKQFQAPNLEHMRTWWSGRGPATYSTVFYPFSGPDIANALAFFPDADTYLMFGLEAPGTIPDLSTMDEAAISAGLSELGRSLNDLFEVNYFFTRAMKKKLGNGSFNSVSACCGVFAITRQAVHSSLEGASKFASIGCRNIRCQCE